MATHPRRLAGRRVVHLRILLRHGERRPSDVNTVYIAGVPLLKSTDGGQTFEHIGAPNVHVDHHKVWIDPDNPRHVLNGNDGGMNVSWDGGASWIKCNSPSVGQFYAVEVDDAEPYNVYGGLQDNGTWKGPHTHKENPAWHQTGNTLPRLGRRRRHANRSRPQERGHRVHGLPVWVVPQDQPGHRGIHKPAPHPRAGRDSAPVELADAHLAEPAPARHLVHGVQQASPLHGPGRNLGNPQRRLDPWRTCWKRAVRHLDHPGRTP